MITIQLNKNVYIFQPKWMTCFHFSVVCGFVVISVWYSPSIKNIIYYFVQTSKCDFVRGHWLKKTLANHFAPLNESHESIQHGQNRASSMLKN